ncbi:MAG: 2-oxo acid dehydrogenase subunit E2 [Clostridia bacterium]|nr:2-oxo acid dehydrogenase subunit E2 [Clostridia bacterium]
MQWPKRRPGDRYDGYRIRKMDAVYQIVPAIMRTRMDSQVFFDYKLDITELEKFVREQRENGMPNLRMLHIFMAAMIRMMSQYPRLNRFIAGKKVFARNCYSISIAIKRSLSINDEETTITPEFEPTFTLQEVVNHMETTLKEQVFDKREEGNATDLVARTLGAIPTFIKAGFVDLMRNLDKIGLMPKFINKASPFHASMFITDLGSCGIGPIYHHLYEFGTCSVFVAMGKKESEYYIDKDGNTQLRRYINMKVVADERICDGYYYASAMKDLARLIRHPERLLTPPEKVVMDDLGRRVKYKKVKKNKK